MKHGKNYANYNLTKNNMKTTTAQLIERLKAFDQAYKALASAWTDASAEDSDKLNDPNVTHYYPFSDSFDERVGNIAAWVEKAVDSLKGFKTKLPESITTIEEAEEFLTELHENGECFNPDDAAQDIVWALPKEQHPTKAECMKLNMLMNEILNLDDFDPYQYILDLDEEEERINKLSRPTEY